MSFVSFHFFVFFPILGLIYFLISPKWRWLVLLAASFYFYMSWAPIFILLLGYSILASFGVVLAMDRKEDEVRRKNWMILGVILLIAPLFFFKYFNFLNQELGRIILGQHALLFRGWNFLLPIGISFYTFQALSYVFDVYRKNRASEKSLAAYALYVSFFPLILSGPIERSTRLLFQMADLRAGRCAEKYQFDPDRITIGLRWILWGFFKKLVIADNLAIIVKEIYSAPAACSGWILLLGSYCFAYQIYCDFAGYTDIARGTAKILGMDVMVNFESPYQSKSIQEFWRRWHISLMSWFRDYVYFPLGGNRVSKVRWMGNIMSVFVLSGIWHGANWTYILWGGFHGFIYLFTRITKGLREKISDFLKLNFIPVIFKNAFCILLTFHAVVFGWILFRAEKISDARMIIWKIIYDVPQGLFQMALQIFNKSWVWNQAGFINLFKANDDQLFMFWNRGMGLILLAVLVLEISDYWKKKRECEFVLGRFPAWIRWSGYYLLGLAIWVCAPLGSNQFIYFQF